MVTHFRNPGMYMSVSALAPVCNPTNCQWGKKAFAGFLGSVEAGAEYDSTLLVGKY
jgi:S-formylglutathione hydrolase